MLQFGWFTYFHNMDFQHRKLLQIPLICKDSGDPSNFPSYSVTAFLVVCFCVIFSKLCKRSRNRSQDSQPQINDETLDKFLVQEYGVVFKYKKGYGLIEGTECSVCLSEFQEDETLKLLPECNHAFHTPCIDTWLRSHRNCPNCRAPLVKNIAKSSLSSTLETTTITSLGPNVDSFGASKDHRLNVPEDDEKTERETDTHVQERSGAQGQYELGVENEGKRGEGLNQGECSAQLMRRSVSLDSLSNFATNQQGLVESNVIPEN